jgi:hypothetical protein
MSATAPSAAAPSAPSARSWTSPCLYYKLKGNKTHKNKGVTKLDGVAVVTFTPKNYSSNYGSGGGSAGQLYERRTVVTDEDGAALVCKVDMVTGELCN